MHCIFSQTIFLHELHISVDKGLYSSVEKKHRISIDRLSSLTKFTIHDKTIPLHFIYNKLDIYIHHK